MRFLLRAGSDCLSSISSQAFRCSATLSKNPVSLFGFTRSSTDLIVGRTEAMTPSAVGARRPITRDAFAGQEFRIGIVGAEHQKQIAMHDGVIVRLRSDHADAAHPAWVVVRHDVLAFDGMDQWRLEPIGE